MVEQPWVKSIWVKDEPIPAQSEPIYAQREPIYAQSEANLCPK